MNLYVLKFFFSFTLHYLSISFNEKSCFFSNHLCNLLRELQHVQVTRWESAVEIVYLGTAKRRKWTRSMSVNHGSIYSLRMPCGVPWAAAYSQEPRGKISTPYSTANVATSDSHVREGHNLWRLTSASVINAAAGSWLTKDLEWAESSEKSTLHHLAASSN